MAELVFICESVPWFEKGGFELYSGLPLIRPPLGVLMIRGVASFQGWKLYYAVDSRLFDPDVLVMLQLSCLNLMQYYRL